MEDAETQLAALREQVQTIALESKKLKEDSPEYDALSEEYVRVAAEIERLEAIVPKQKAARTRKSKRDAVDAAVAATPTKKRNGEVVALDETDYFRGTAGKYDTALGAAAVRALHKGDVRAALAHIAATSTNPVARQLAARFAGLAGTVRVRVVKEMLGDNPDSPGGISRDGTNILLHRETGLSEETLLHEVGHALTLHTLGKPETLLTPEQRAAKRELEAMHEEIKRADSLDNDVVKEADIREFVAEVYGSQQVQEHMRNTQWSYGPKKGRVATMWSAIKTAFMRFIGVKVPPDGNMHDKYMELADKFLRTPEREDVQTSRGAEVGHFRDPLRAVLRAGLTGKPTPLQKAKDNKSILGLAARQNIADHRAAIREVLSRVGTRAEKDASAWTITTLDAAPSNTMATLEYGAAHVGANGKLEVGKNTSFKKVLEDIGRFPGYKGEEALNLFHIHRVAARANSLQDGWKVLNYKDPAGMRVKAKMVEDAINRNPALKAAVARADATYNAFNRGKLELLRDTHALPADDVARMLADPNYIPFYRQNGDTINLIMPNGHPFAVGDIRTQPFLRALKGGDESLLGFVDSEVKNAHLLTQLAMENMAKKNIAARLQDLGKTRTGPPGPRPTMVIRKGEGVAGPDTLVFRVESTGPKDDGQRHIVVDTQGTIAQDVPSTLVSQAIAGSYSTPNMFLDMSHAMSSLLRTGVTRFPLYTVKQLFKDPISASIQGHVRANPAMAVAKSIWEYGKIMSGNSKEAKILQSHGIIHSDVFGGTSDLAKVAKQMTGGGTWWTSKVAAFLDKSAMAADAATRTQAYKDVLARGGSETAALLQAREMQNFSRRGGAAWVQFFNHSIPFFNSSIQSMDTMLRAARGKMPNEELLKTKQTFALRAAGMMAAAAVYYAAMEDDEKWRKMSLRDKISYIHLPDVFDTEPMRLPAPFEVGMLFYSLPIALLENAKSELSTKDWETVRSILWNQLPGGGSLVPQVGKIPLDLTRNYNSFTEKPIVPANQQGLAPEQQYGPQTSEFARRAGETTGTASYKWDYAVQALVGQWAKIAGSATEMLFQKASEDHGEKPEGHASDNPVYGSLFQSARSNEDVEHVFEQYAKAKEAKATYDDMVKRGLKDEAREWGNAHKEDIALYGALAGFAAELGNLRTLDKRIRDMKDTPGTGTRMSSEDKQKKLDMLQDRSQMIANKYQTRLKQYHASAGQ